jgi:hypothetical protein
VPAGSALTTGPPARFWGVLGIGPGRDRPSWPAWRIEKIEKPLDGLPVGDMMMTMKRIASNLFIQSKHPGTGKVCPQGWPRRDTASLTPVPTYLKGCSNGTYRTRAERQT